MRTEVKKAAYVPAAMVVGSIVTSLFLASCGKEQPAGEPVALPVKMVTYGGEEAEHFKTYPGTTDADQTADLAYENPGRLIKLPVDRGEMVRKGQLLAQLDPLDFESKVAARKAEFVEARADLDRYRQLYEQDAVPLADLEVKRRQFDVAKANLAIAEKALRDTALKAPFDGIIARKFVENYQDVKAKEPIIRLQDVSRIEVLINIPENDIMGVPGEMSGTAPGDIKAYAVFGSVPGREFQLALKEFEAQADPKTQAFLVKFVMPNPDDVNVLPGMTAQVRISTRALRQAPSEKGTVPVSAVFFDESGKQYVWVVDKATETVKRREVSVGKPTGNNITILGGLKEGDTIVTTGVYRLQEGSKVRPYERLMEPPKR
jgi:multidrug efflux system membrane fusion protein